MASKSVRRRKRSTIVGSTPAVRKSNRYDMRGKTKHTGESYDTVTGRLVQRGKRTKKTLVQTRSNKQGQVRGIF